MSSPTPPDVPQQGELEGEAVFTTGRVPRQQRAAPSRPGQDCASPQTKHRSRAVSYSQTMFSQVSQYLSAPDMTSVTVFSTRSRVMVESGACPCPAPWCSARSPARCPPRPATRRCTARGTQGRFPSCRPGCHRGVADTCSIDDKNKIFFYVKNILVPGEGAA